MADFEDRESDTRNTQRRNAAPPEEVLAAPANKLDTNPHPRDVTLAATELIEAVDTVIDAVDAETATKLTRYENPVDRATALADAVEHGDVTLRGSSAGPDQNRQQENGTEKVSQAAEAVQHEQSPTTDPAVRMLETLATLPETPVEELTETLTEMVTTVETHEMLDETLAQLPSEADPAAAGEQLKTNCRAVQGESAQRLGELGHTLQTTGEQLTASQRERDELANHLVEIATTAEEQTETNFDTAEGTELGEQLCQALEIGTVRFADSGDQLAQIASEVSRTSDGTSGPANAFLEVLQSDGTASVEEMTTQLNRAVRAINRTETVGARLDGVEPAAVERMADRLLETLSGIQGPVSRELHDRVRRIKQTAGQTNEDDLLSLYASKQELRYYDRSLIPALATDGSPEGTAADSADLTERLDTLEEQRSSMRQSYPVEYPDCDHTIPIYFFDLAADLLESAEVSHEQGDRQEAEGLVVAVEQLLDQIEGLYETHSYFVLLRELRN